MVKTASIESGMSVREAFKNKNDETYGKFFHDFLLSKKDF